MLSLAEQLIFERYKRPEFAGTFEPADIVSDGINQSCGDEVRIFVQLAGESVAQMKHMTRACAICTASADLLSERIAGASLATLPTEDEVVAWLDIPLSPVRRKCAVLPLQTLKRGLSSVLNRSVPDGG